MVIHVDLFEDDEFLCSTFLTAGSVVDISEVCKAAINRYLEREEREPARNPEYCVLEYYYDNIEAPIRGQFWSRR